jgi:hypothetical protein
MNGLTYGEKTEWARNEKEKSRNKEWEDKRGDTKKGKVRGKWKIEDKILENSNI